MLNKAFTELNQYVAYFRSVEFPVLKRSALDLQALQEQEEMVSARQIAGAVLNDPLLALKLLIYLQRTRRQSQNHDITTIERAIMMLGVSPFFARFTDLQTVESQLTAHPKALLGVLKVISRAKQASRYARDFALLRHDVDVDEIAVAALLHEAAEILCWCFAPELTQQSLTLQAQNPGMRSAVAQRAVMGIAIADLQLALVREYELPELLVTLMNHSASENPRVQTVVLACDLARHAANGWQDAALPDDFRAIAALLHLDIAVTMQKIGVPPGIAEAIASGNDPLVE